jgi:glycine/sarcosine N-methyltransferase
MMETDLYAGFAERYDLVTGRLDESDHILVEFFRRIFSQNGVQTVLDCACGTGRHLLLFHSLGCQVWGSDASAAMLDQARKNTSHLEREGLLRQADYRDLPQHFRQPFDAVTCLGSIGYMRSETEFLRAFRSMHAVLRPGGILILTTIPTDRQWKEKPRFKMVVNTPAVTRLFVMDYLEQSVGYHVLDIFHSPEADELRVWSAELTVLLRDTQERLLKSAGFQQVDFYGDFDFSPYSKENSHHLITVAQKSRANGPRRKANDNQNPAI